MSEPPPKVVNVDVYDPSKKTISLSIVVELWFHLCVLQHAILTLKVICGDALLYDVFCGALGEKKVPRTS